MKKNIITILIAIIFMIGGIVITQGLQTLTMEAALVRCFQSSNAEVMESTLSCWTKINDEFMTAEQVKKQMDDALAKLDPEASTINIIPQNDEETNKLIATAEKNGVNYSVIVESMNIDNKGETYVVIDVSMDKQYKNLPEERQKIQSYLTDIGKATKINSCIIGTFDGKLTEEEMHHKINSALKSIRAKKVEGLDMTDLNSITAFSDSIDGYVMSNNKKINLQIALRYSTYENKTYLWIGAPLIPMEY